MAARVDLLAEVRRQRRDLAAVVFHQLGHLPKPTDFVGLAAVGPLGELLDQCVDVGRGVHDSVAVSHAGGPHFQQLLLAEVVQRGDHPSPIAGEFGAHAVHVDVEPRPGLARPLEEARQERPPLAVEPREDLVGRRQRPKLVGRVERRAALDVAEQFEVRQQRARHQRPNVVTVGQRLEGDIELRPEREDLPHERVDRTGSGRVAVDEVLQRSQVVLAGEHLADRRLAVASGPADFLRVVLQALGQVVVIHVADVRLVDAHPEGNGGHHDPVVRGEEPVLDGCAGVGVQPGVVSACVQGGVGKQLRDALGRLLPRDVDDGRPGRSIGEAGQQGLVTVQLGSGRQQQRQVRPIEARPHRTLRGDLKHPADVLQHARRGGGRQRQNTLRARRPRKTGQLQVVRAEVVAPLGNAVGLVHREQRNVQPLKHLAEPLVVEPLRGDV